MITKANPEDLGDWEDPVPAVSVPWPAPGQAAGSTPHHSREVVLLQAVWTAAPGIVQGYVAHMACTVVLIHGT